MPTKRHLSAVIPSFFVLMGLATPVLAGDKNEMINAMALETGTQLDKNLGVTLRIRDYSTPEGRTILVKAFQKGSNQELVNALENMKSVGLPSITGALGMQVSYILLIPTQQAERSDLSSRPINSGEASGCFAYPFTPPKRCRYIV